MEIVIILFNIFLFYRTFNFSVIVDDVRQYQHIMKGAGNLKTLKDYLIFLRTRIYGGGTFFIQNLSKDIIKNEKINVKIDHILTTLLHTIACLLIYKSLGNNNISFWASMLYACNPINNQTSIWLNGRRYLLNIILVLLMMLWKPIGMYLYFLTPLLQISAIFSPVLLSLQYPIFLLAIPLVAFQIKNETKSKIIERFRGIPDDDRKIFTPKRIVIIIKQYGHYIFKMIIPNHCAFIYKRLHYWGRTKDGNRDAYSLNYDFYKGIIALLFTAITLFFIPTEYKPIVLFVFLSTIQWCALIPVTGDLADRYVSLPNVFCMFILSYAIITFIPGYSTHIFIGIIAYYSMCLFKTMRMYKDFPSYWEYHRYFSPDVPMPMNTEAKYYLDRNNPMRAWMIVSDGLKYNPNDFNLLQLAAIIHKTIGEFSIAESFARKALDNCYLYQRNHQEKHILMFIDSLKINQKNYNKNIKKHK